MNAVIKPIVKIQEERYSDALRAEFQPLLWLHWREIANYQDTIPLAPNFDLYARADAAGRLLALTARMGNDLVGYSIMMLLHPPHYSTTFVAMNDVIWVAPDHRKGRVGLSLIRESERCCKARGCIKISWHVKEKNADGSDNPLAPVLRKLGYEGEELTLGRLL